MTTISIKKQRTVTETTTVTIHEPRWWRVSTEGDVEGRTVRDLGVHNGSLLDLCKALAGSASYTLSFSLVQDEIVASRRQPKDVTINVAGVDNAALAAAFRSTGHDTSSAGNGVTVSLEKKW